ncbi:eukaryotic translation initiation factor 2B subunit beta [Arctopsyche grandis]|uniref:eukaryotic translation initiation factor 2B subunit beta n=1 Tax=Arctopsyche grandis TaxID=121162 RepID=UPI00406D8736
MSNDSIELTCLVEEAAGVKLDSWQSVRMPEETVRDPIVKFISDVKTRKIDGSFKIAVNTVTLLKDLIQKAKFENAEELLDQVKTAGKLLVNRLPQEAVAGNMVRRILCIIRTEYIAATKDSSSASASTTNSLEGIVRPNDEAATSYRKNVPNLKETVLEHISEFQIELETCLESIASQATEHIHSNEIILTLGASRLVESFLKRAAQKRQFHVLVAENAPNGEGHRMAAQLAKAKIETTVIADSAIFAVMSRVNKVMLGTQTVLAGGGLRAVVGSHTVALAAKHYSVPVIILCPLYKLCPEHLCNYEQEQFNILASPEGALPYSNGQLIHRTHAYCPIYDYVPPDLVTLFITNSGNNAPSYIYYHLSELYHRDDYKL